jgi:hypothetical protein
MEDDTQKIWRYMDFAKFISLLANEALFFPCPSMFNDPFEGHKPRSEVKALSKMLQQPYNDEIELRNKLKKLRPDADLRALDCSLENFREIARNGLKIVNRKFGVSCWHKSEHESEAMWKLYSNSGQGIAIESTVKQLREAIVNKDGLTIDSVRYLDFDKDPIDKGHKHYGLFQKRMSFEHERELRATILLEEADYGKGAFVACDLNALISNIHISPFLRAYIKNDVEKLCSGKIRIINKPVILSSLFNEPHYGIEIAFGGEVT